MYDKRGGIGDEVHSFYQDLHFNEGSDPESDVARLNARALVEGRPTPTFRKNLPRIAYRLFQHRPAKFAEVFLPLSLENSERFDHPFDTVYRRSHRAAGRFLLAFPITSAMRPEPMSPMDERGSSRFVLRVQPVDQERIAKLSRLFPEIDYLEKRVFQKYFMDQHGNMARSLRLVGKFGQPVLKFNNIGAIGRDVGRGDRVNLFVGASDAFEASSQRVDSNFTRMDWLSELDVPYSESVVYINGGVEGAHFPLIIRKAKRLTSEIIRVGGVVENLFVFGGWHNLIYNLNTKKDWEGYARELANLAPRTVFFRIPSPLLEVSFPEIERHCKEGFHFWGAIPCTLQNYEAIRSQIIEYNSWLTEFCVAQANCLAVPLDRIFRCDSSSLRQLYRDINHFSFSNESATLARDAVSNYLAERSSFFAPDALNVSEFIYPLF